MAAAQSSFTTHFDRQLKGNWLSDKEIKKVKLWWPAYPTEVHIDQGKLNRARKFIQNDDSRPACASVKGCECAKHGAFELKLFDPVSVKDNSNDFPIRMVLSSHYFPGDSTGISDAHVHRDREITAAMRRWMGIQ
jgi:hypothetical protein